MDILNLVGLMLVSQFIAPLDALNLPPLFARIKIKEVKHTDARDESEYTLGMSGIKVPYDETHHIPESTHITYDYSIYPIQWHSGTNHLSINHESGLVNYDGILFSEDGGSGMIGLYIFGFVGLLVFSPILLLNYFVWNLIEKAFGMDRYALSFYFKTRSQLNPDIQLQLKQAFQNFYSKLKSGNKF